MSPELRVFVIFLLVNAAISLGYFFFMQFSRKTDRRKSTLRAVVMLFAPGVGILLFVLGYIGYKLIFNRDVDLSDVVFNKERGQELVRTNEEQDRNVVPLEEAIEITDNAGLRSLVMNVASGDFNESLAAISLALNCEDTETAHYAASVLQDALNSFRMNVQVGYQDVQKRGDGCIDRGRQLLQYMNKVLVQKVFSAVEQRSFVNIMDEVGQILFEEKPESISSDLYEMICLRLLEVEEYERCELWCERATEFFPNTLSSYTCRLKLYFNRGDKERFFQVMGDLKQSSVIIDTETLSLIRTFQG